MKKYLPPIVAGFIAGVLHVVPLVKALTCCLIIPMSAVFAIILEQKSNNLTGEIDLKRGAIIGLLTGLFAAFFGSFFDIFITFVTKNNDILLAFNELSGMIDKLPVTENVKEEALNMMQSVVNSIKETGFSSLYALSILFNNIIVDSVFGLIGGLVGTKVLNSKKNNLIK